ncbi:hypothetical protein IF1G_10962 [Cordyceps javanica]|uniref:Uncharacterized protein n=1 Tax=Cordyceps javanica TaxID=43265 RepID=A0A545ULI7_9HYPO|nr:hypothetical protein IF1G_10962 [Cordyceps javanica]
MGRVWRGTGGNLPTVQRRRGHQVINVMGERAVCSRMELSGYRNVQDVGESNEANRAGGG